MTGFPNDDMNALQQMASGGSFLDSIYPYQFVQNETLLSSNCPTISSCNTASFLFHRQPVLAGTVVGTLYVNNIAVQTFAAQSDGTTKLQTIANPAIKAENITISPTNGLVTVYFDDNVNPHSVSVVASYEYSVEAQESGSDDMYYGDVDEMDLETMAEAEICSLQGAFMEMFMICKEQEQRKVLLNAIEALDQVLFKVVKGGLNEVG